MRPSYLLPILALAACTDGERGNALRPSMSQIRYGLVQIEPEEEPILPEILHVPGITINSEDEEGYDDPVPLLLTPEQLEKLTELEDPAALEKHLSYAYETMPGDLFDEAEGDVLYDDIRQGAIADCYFAAALSAVLYADEDRHVRDGLIREVLDASGDPSHYAVRFYDAWGVPQDVEIDADLVRSSAGNPTYLRSLDSTGGNEEWALSLIEKAYAEWHGGYEEIGNGGNSGDVMQAMSGSNSSYRSLKYLSDDSLLRTITSAVEDHRPMTAGTYGEDSGVDYSGTGVYAWHAYTVLDARRTEEGELRVKLRNPWGSSEPAGNGPDDGIFEMAAADFRRLYQGLTIGGGFTADVAAPDAVSDLRVVDAYDGSLVLEATATGDDGSRGLATAYDLRISTSAIDDNTFYQADRVPVASPQAPGSTDRFEVTGLDNGTTYYLAVRVEDESGNLSPISQWVSGTPAAEQVDDSARPDLMFDFEGDVSGWEAGGIFHLSERWSASGERSFYAGDEATGTYDLGHVTGDLTSPLLDLDGVTAPVLVWEQKLDVEPGADHDRVWVEVATEADGFDVWTKVWEKGEHTTGAKETVEVPLSAYAGQRIHVFFFFDSLDAVDNAFEGWYVDDVRIVGE